MYRFTHRGDYITGQHSLHYKKVLQDINERCNLEDSNNQRIVGEIDRKTGDEISTNWKKNATGMDDQLWVTHVGVRRVSWVVLWYSDMCTWNICTRHVSTIICVKRELACMLPLRHNREYFVKYQNIFWRSQWMVLSMENISWEIFGDMCEYGHVSWDNIWRWVCWVQLYGHGSCKTHHIEKSKKHAYP